MVNAEGMYGTGICEFYRAVLNKKENSNAINGKESGFLTEVEKAENAVLTKEQEMELFKKEFWEEVARIPKTPTLDNLAINISEKGWERMKEEPEYREKMMGLIRRDTTGSFIHQVNSIITIGASDKEYRADSWSSESDEFWSRAKEHDYMEARKKRKKELQEYYDKLWLRHFYEQRKLI